VTHWTWFALVFAFAGCAGDGDKGKGGGQDASVPAVDLAGVVADGSPVKGARSVRACGRGSPAEIPGAGWRAFRVVMNPAGKLIAVSDGPRALFYDAGKDRWDINRQITTLTGGEWAKVAQDRAGNSMVVWIREGAVSPPEVWASLSRVESDRWDAQYRVDQWVNHQTKWGKPTGVASANITMNNNGKAAVVWDYSTAYGGKDEIIYAALFDQKSRTWTRGTLVTDDHQNIGRLQLQMDAAGNVIVVWDSHKKWRSDSQSFAARYDAARKEWQAPVPIGPSITPNGWPTLAMDSDGNALVVTAAGHLYWTWFDAATQTWLPPARVHDQVETSGVPQLVITPGGDAHALHASNSTFVTTFSRSSISWGTPRKLSIHKGKVGSAVIAADPKGNAAVVWWHLDPADWTPSYSPLSLQAARYSAASKVWSNPMVIQPPALFADGHSVAMSDNDVGIILWSTAASRDKSYPWIITGRKDHACLLLPQT